MGQLIWALLESDTLSKLECSKQVQQLQVE